MQSHLLFQVPVGSFPCVHLPGFLVGPGAITHSWLSAEQPMEAWGKDLFMQMPFFLLFTAVSLGLLWQLRFKHLVLRVMGKCESPIQTASITVFA